MLTVREFMNLMELKGHANYKELQKITLGLMKKVLIIKEPDLKVITQVAWLSSARYEEGEGFIKLSFAPEMHPFLLQLKDRFTAISITCCAPGILVHPCARREVHFILTFLLHFVILHFKFRYKVFSIRIAF